MSPSVASVRPAEKSFAWIVTSGPQKDPNNTATVFPHVKENEEERGWWEGADHGGRECSFH